MHPIAGGGGVRIKVEATSASASLASVVACDINQGDQKERGDHQKEKRREEERGMK